VCRDLRTATGYAGTSIAVTTTAGRAESPVPRRRRIASREFAPTSRVAPVRPFVVAVAPTSTGTAITAASATTSASRGINTAPAGYAKVFDLVAKTTD